QYAAQQLSKVESWTEVTMFWSQCLSVSIAVLLCVTAPPLFSKLLPQLVGWSFRGFWWWLLELSLSLLTGTLAFMLFAVPFMVSSSTPESADEFFNLNA